MEVRDLELRPVEALFLLSLAKKESFNTQNALVAVIAFLCQRQILNHKHGSVKLTKRGYRLRTDSNLLDPSERGISWFLNTNEHKRMISFLNNSQFSQALIKKELIIKQKKYFFSFFGKNFILTEAGKEKVELLVKIRHDILFEKKKDLDISILSIFPSIHGRVNHKNLLIIKNYVQQIFNGYQEKPMYAWLKPGLKYS